MTGSNALQQFIVVAENGDSRRYFGPFDTEEAAREWMESEPTILIPALYTPWVEELYEPVNWLTQKEFDDNMAEQLEEME